MTEISNNIDPLDSKHRGLAKRMFDKYVRIPNNVTIPALTKKIEDIKEIVEHDDLTRVLSKKYIEKYANDLVAKNEKFTLLFVDADYFKKVNDDNGHYVGDMVLKIVGQRLLHSVSEDDKVGRVGGEEFIVILNQVTSLEVANKRAEEIRGLFSDNPIHVEDNDGKEKQINQTISIGVAVYNGNESFIGLKSRADKALYSAKNEGRNRVVVSNS